MMLRTLCCLAAAACAVPVAPPPSAAGPVRLLVDGNEVAFREPAVLSIDDANARFHVNLTAPTVFANDSGIMPVLHHGEQGLRSSSWGNDGKETWFVFPVNASDARTIAAALGVVARERPPWTGQLEAQLRAPGEVAAGAATVPLQFELTNTGPLPLWFLDGGRGRNQVGRDNRFQFVVDRDGTALPIIEVHDFGGIAMYRRLGPGESWTFDVDLAHWCRLAKPGVHRVRATYGADLMPPEYEPGQTLAPGLHSHLQRERTVAAELVLTVHE